MAIYNNTIDRITLEVQEFRDGGSVFLTIPDGWNDSVQKVRNTLTTEELHDLRYLIDRAIVALDAEKLKK